MPNPLGRSTHDPPPPQSGSYCWEPIFGNGESFIANLAIYEETIHALRRPDVSFSTHSRFAERLFLRGAAVALLASVGQFGVTVRSAHADAEPAPAAGALTITAFRDYDASGAKNAGVPGEPGLGAVKATALCVTGAGRLRRTFGRQSIVDRVRTGSQSRRRP